jgi:sugar lactone lactonase YvrE
MRRWSLLAALAFAACDESDNGEAICEPGPGIACVYMGTGVAGLGDDQLAPRQTELYLPQDVTAGPNGTVYVVDWNNHRIRSVKDDLAVTLIGTGYLGDAPAGNATEVSLNHPTHVSVQADGKLIVAAWHNSKILSYDPATNQVEPICGTGARSFSGDGEPAVGAVLDLPVATATGPDGSWYISDQANQRVRRVGPDGIIQTVVGNGIPGFSGDGGPATEAQLHLPVGQSAPPAGRIATDAEGRLYIADSANHRIRLVDTDGTISTVAGDGTPAYHGDGGPAVAASLFRPNDVAIDRDGNLFIADTDNSCIRRVDPDGIISAVAGVCGSAGLGEDGVLANEIFLDRPYGIALADDGTLYIADTHNHRIVAVTPE